MRHAAAADISIVEGNKGLYDGLALDGSNSNAAVAKALDLPVILVIDARGMTRGVAPLILGYQAFDRDVRIAGVILNNLGGSRHEAKLRLVIEHYTDVPVLGAVHCDPRLAIVERHLGLLPSNEADGAAERVAAIGSIVGRQVDLDGVLACCRRRAAGRDPRRQGSPTRSRRRPKATCESASRRTGRSASTMPTTSMRCARREQRSSPSTRSTTPSCPSVDGLFIGGGFPELFAAELEANMTLRAEIRDAIEAGPARLRRMRRAHVSRPHAPTATASRTGWSAPSRRTS